MAVYTDDFNRASLGADWTNIPAPVGWGEMQIVSSLYATGVTDADQADYYNAGAFGTYPYSKIVIYRSGSATDQIGAVLCHATDGTYVALQYAGNVHLWRINAGDAWTELGTAYAHTVADGDVLYVEINPTTNHVRVTINGTQTHDVVDTTYRTLKAGIYSAHSTTSYLCINSWEGGDVGEGGGTTTVAKHRGPYMVGMMHGMRKPGMQ